MPDIPLATAFQSYRSGYTLLCGSFSGVLIGETLNRMKDKIFFYSTGIGTACG